MPFIDSAIQSLPRPRPHFVKQPIINMSVDHTCKLPFKYNDNIPIYNLFPTVPTYQPQPQPYQDLYQQQLKYNNELKTQQPYT